MLNLFSNDFSYLPAIMNYSNALFASLTIIPAYLIVRRLFGDPTVAFCSVLLLMFVPIFFQGSIYGAPHVIAFFFFMSSIYLFLLWLDNRDRSSGYALLCASSLSLLLMLLFKTPIILAGGIYIGLLYLRRVKDTKHILLSLVSLALTFAFFLIIRKQLVTASTGSTSSPAEMIEWFRHFFSMPSFDFFLRQIKPPFFGAGAAVSLVGAVSFLYFMYKRKGDVLVFVLSWIAASNIFWLFVLGNNARHFMVSVFPLCVMIVMFIKEKAPRHTLLFCGLIIICNFLVFPASSSTYYPSGNLFASSKLLEARNLGYHEKAGEITDLDQDKVAVMGSFHTPYVVYELIKSAPTYEGALLTSTEKAVIRILTEGKEYLVVYIASDDPRANIERAYREYDYLDSYYVLSTNFDLAWLTDEGKKTLDIGLVPPQIIPRFRSIIERN